MPLVVFSAQVNGNIYTVVTHLHVVDILTYIYCNFVHLTSLFEVGGGVQRSKHHMKFWFYALSISYRLNCFIYDCHNWWYICSFLLEDGIIVFQGQSSRSHVKHCYSCQKRYIIISLARTANFDTYSYLKLKRKFIFYQGKSSYLKASLERLLSEHYFYIV